MILFVLILFTIISCSFNDSILVDFFSKSIGIYSPIVPEVIAKDKYN